MNFNMKTTTDKPQNSGEKAVFVNNAGFGKAGNQAIQIMIAQGHFSKADGKLDATMILYKELTKQIYKTDLECIEELKEELQ